MAVQTLLLLTSFALAALLGFAAHRASICTVKAVEEVLTTRRAFMLLSFAKTVLWVMAVTALLLWALPEAPGNLAGWQVSLTGLAGGLIFGMGAVFNKGCAFSTLTRLDIDPVLFGEFALISLTTAINDSRISSS